MKLFTADPHLGADHIHQFAHRPFFTAADHHAYMVAGINKRARRGDTLVVVGDFCHGDPRPWLSQIICDDIILYRGNHDDDEHNHRFLRYFDQGYEELANGKKVWCNHYPALYWRGSHNNSWHVYGHEHAVREDYINALFPQRAAMEVSVDNARRILGDFVPFTEDEIIQQLEGKQGHDLLLYYKTLDQIRQHHSVDNQGKVVTRPVGVDKSLRAITLEEYHRWSTEIQTLSSAAA